MKQVSFFVCTCVILALGCGEMVPGTCYENPTGGAGGGGPIPSTSGGPTSGTGDFLVDPEKRPQDYADPPASCMVPPGPCEKKCLDVYEQDAIKCGKLTDPTQYNACHDTAFKKYWTCHENCEQGAALSCTDMFVACKDKGWPCTKQIDKKKTLCAFCLDDCNADRPYKFSQCYTCGFR